MPLVRPWAFWCCGGKPWLPEWFPSAGCVLQLMEFVGAVLTWEGLSIAGHVMLEEFSSSLQKGLLIEAVM